MKKALSLVFANALAGIVLSAPALAQDLKGNAEKGAAKVAMCIGCHGIPGYQASFPEVYKVPMISGQGAGYIASSLTAYRAGERKHPSMRAIALSLSDQDILDLAAFYEPHLAKGDRAPAAPPEQAAAPSAEVQKLLTKGGCVACHGSNFSKPIPGSPKIAGQHADYLFAALRAYKIEGNPNVGRANVVMAGMVKQYSNAELKSIAGYLGSLPGELRTVRQPPFHTAAR